MKTRKSKNGNQPLTLAQFERAMEKIDKRFDLIEGRLNLIEKRLDKLETDMKIVNAKLASFIAIITSNIEHAIRA